MVEGRWKRNPKPDAEVIRVLEEALEAARMGYVRAAVVVMVNPVHEVKIGAAGHTTGILRTVLIGGLFCAAHKLLNSEAQ